MRRGWVAACLLATLSLHTARADLDAGLELVQKKEYSAARVEFEILAEKGDPDAQVNLGNLYMKGWGVNQDYAEAYDWYRKAAEQNSRIAQSKLGILHYYGLGTLKDSAEAAKWFEKAADQGDASAQSVLGALCAQGDGVARNLVKAYFWLTLAFEFGNSNASDLRSQLAEEMTPGEMADALGRVEEWNRDKGIPDPGRVPIEESAPVPVDKESSQAGGSDHRPQVRKGNVNASTRKSTRDWSAGKPQQRGQPNAFRKSS